MSTRRALPFLSVLLFAGCADGEGPESPSARATVEVVNHAYFPRPAHEDFWETIRLADVGSEFLLYVHPRIRTPAEGPWTITFVDPAGEDVARHTGLRVDTATGRFTFLCSTARFTPGDWIIRLEVEEGGLVGGERERTFRFRVV